MNALERIEKWYYPNKSTKERVIAWDMWSQLAVLQGEQQEKRLVDFKKGLVDDVQKFKAILAWMRSEKMTLRQVNAELKDIFGDLPDEYKQKINKHIKEFRSH